MSARPVRISAAPDRGEVRPPRPGETAAYICALSGDLSALARRSGLDVLAYLLSMARLEAETAMNLARFRADDEAEARSEKRDAAS